MVSEWSFKKDGVDAAMKDLANETRGAQTDDRDTFLGIGQKRYCINASTVGTCNVGCQAIEAKGSCPNCISSILASGYMKYAIFQPSL